MAYKVTWTLNAKEGLQDVIFYLEQEWTSKEILKLDIAISATVKTISSNPLSFPLSSTVIEVHKEVVDKNNFIAYEVLQHINEVRTLAFQSTKKLPKY
ncbi:type II toxin-antitoxin system RelE/ParE family toxin [uncultured Dokdonia sp.]|uniref:type II toxin-antitoxin system RelE/ParE family toxin n=1 Tax=uncultured Dokdonia sp. TaxID=575653 RepID=UPI00260AF977|nr:type II toxin-antitoxin system RelE/ParE family toxin [uncultured Dokdonia sp.]